MEKETEKKGEKLKKKREWGSGRGKSSQTLVN